MKPFNAPHDWTLDAIGSDPAVLEQRWNVLKYITEIGTSLRLYMDTNALVQRISSVVCNALDFRHAALYLYDLGNFAVYATAGISQSEEEYLRQHPLPEDVMSLLMHSDYRVSNSYFIPAEASIWKNAYVKSLFVVVEDKVLEEQHNRSAELPASSWHAEDLLLVPLFKSDGSLLGFLTPDSPLDNQRPTEETVSMFELFANQAAVAIEGTRLYEEVWQHSEERAVLVEIARALSSPDALRDLQTIYRTIYKQVCRVMPVDELSLTRYVPEQRTLIVDYRIKDEQEQPAGIPYELSEHSMQLFKHSFQDLRFSTLEEYLKYMEIAAPEVDQVHFKKRYGAAPPQSFLFSLIQYGGRPLGFISVQCKHEQAYTLRHVELLKEIGGQAAIAITNARLYEEQREALKRAQESEHLKNHFLITASHELRTPLTAIQGYLELLGDFAPVLDDISKQRFINNARRACEELVLLLGNVMDASRIGQDMMTLKPGPVNVLLSARLIVEILEPIISREEREVELAIDEDEYVWVDDLRLRQILLNLVGNALKYTPAGTKIFIGASQFTGERLERRIPVHKRRKPVEYSGSFVVIEIRDWGPGVAMQDQARLFNKFIRLDEALNSVQRGAGLGLFLCLQLTEGMGGHIWMESRGISGEGSRFFVALPRYHEKE